MAIRLDAEIEVVLDHEGEEVVAHFPPYNDPELIRHQKRLLTSRVEYGRRGKVNDLTTERRIAFFDATCRRVEGLEDRNGTGEYVPVGPEHFEDWKERVPPNFKSSFVAVFEERARLTDDDRKN